MTARPPVWLLDIDGVVNAITKKPDRNVWPLPTWIRTQAHGSGVDWPVWTARPVLDFIRRVHDTGAAEVRWHTTWQHEATNYATAVDLPDFPVLPCPEYADHQKAGGARPIGAVWWKLAAAERVVRDEGRSLLWTDDDADHELRRADRVEDRLREIAPVLIVCPRENLGLTRKHLRQIAKFLDVEIIDTP